MENLFELYKKIKLITKSEKKLIAENDFNGLNEKLNEKNQIIKKIELVDQKKYFAELAFSHNLEELKNKKEDLVELIKEISNLQVKNKKKLEEKKIESKEKMLSLYNREKSLKAYLNSDKYEAKFFDEKS